MTWQANQKMLTLRGSRDVGTQTVGGDRKNIDFLLNSFKKNIDFERRAGSGAAGDRKIIDFLLNSF